MKKMSLFAIVAAVTVIIFSCSKEEPVVSGEYFPLAVGNYWQMDYSLMKTVSGTIIIGGEEYFCLKSGNLFTYLRVEGNHIYRTDPEGNSVLLYDLGADVNEKWLCGNYQATMMSKNATVIAGDTTLSDCYQILFDIPQVVDDEYTIWLAPGIGEVQRCCECVNPVQKVVTAGIDGHVYEF